MIGLDEPEGVAHWLASAGLSVDDAAEPEVVEGSAWVAEWAGEGWAFRRFLEN